MIYWACVVIVLHTILSVSVQSRQLNSKCHNITAFAVGNRTTELECCETIVHNYYTKFGSHNSYLSTFLESLQTWNCPQFRQECERRTFNYTDFTSLMYLRFCNRSQMEAHCHHDILIIVTKQNYGIPIKGDFNHLVSKLDLIILSEKDLMNPCVQVAMYDSDSGNQDHFHEIIEPVLPFCSFLWCGFTKNVFIENHVAPWTCMASRCRLILILYFVANILLALAIVVCNATILWVLYLKKQEAQTIYRLSLAVADFIMGAVVIPVSMGTVYKDLVQSPSFTELRNVTDYVTISKNSLPLQTVDVNLKELNDFLSDEFLRSDIYASGFFNILSLSVSVPSLVAASFDRLVAIFCPLRYNKLKALIAAKIAVAFVWLVALVFAILPIAFPDLGYSFVFAIILSFGGNPIVIVYGIVFYLMVVLMWCSIIATCVAARPSLRRHDRQHQTDDEMHLLGTLGIMAAVFTICVIPEGIILITSLYLPHLDLRNPTDFDAAAAMRFTSIEISIKMVLASYSLWNCFIYSIRETTFRKATKLLYKRIAQCLKLDQAWNLVLRKT